MVGLFCGVVNCPVASVLLSIEVFGVEGMILFALSCGISYMMSGNYGLYHSQIIYYSKLEPRRVERFAH
jgi:H+/Cl- antiporter ClcA